MPDLPLSEQQQLEERVAARLRRELEGMRYPWRYGNASICLYPGSLTGRAKITALARAALAALDSVGGPEPDKLREEAVRAVEKLLCGKPWAARAVLHRVLKETGEVPNWWPPGDEPLGNQDGGLATSPVTSPLSRVPAGGEQPAGAPREQHIDTMNDTPEKALANALATWDLVFPPTGHIEFHDVAARQVVEELTRHGYVLAPGSSGGEQKSWQPMAPSFDVQLEPLTATEAEELLERGRFEAGNPLADKLRRLASGESPDAA